MQFAKVVSYSVLLLKTSVIPGLQYTCYFLFVYVQVDRQPAENNVLEDYSEQCRCIYKQLRSWGFSLHYSYFILTSF
jgi:hypothetical protein